MAEEVERTSGSVTSGARSANVGLTTDFEPNLLDNYDTYTYHFRLFMMGEDAIRAGAVGPESRAQRVVIAESGATSIEIDNVEIRSIVGISNEAGVGASTNFSLTLRQPFGADLLDKIFEAANSLGIRNFAKVPVFLELSFRGRNPEGHGNQEPLRDDELSDLVWVWPIFFNRMALDISAGGSTYQLEAVIYGDVAFTNEAADLEKTINIKATNVKEFFDGLERQLNEKEEQKKATRQTVFDKYEFYIDKAISQSKIVPEVAEQVANRAAEFDIENSEKNEFIFHPGISIDRIVETILSTTRFFQNAAKGTDDSDAYAEERQGEKATIQTLFRVITDTKLGQFDPGRNDYQRIYRYLIVPYEMATIQTQSNVSSGQTSQQRYDQIRNLGRLRKAYNYIYTGLNDQVLDFNLTFNFNWYAAIPYQSGVTTNASQSDIAAAKPEEDVQSKVEKKDREAFRFGSEETGGTDRFGLGEFVITADRIGPTETQGETISGINNGTEDQLAGDGSTLQAINVSQGLRINPSDRSVDQAQQNLQQRQLTMEDVSEGERDINPIASNVSFIESMPGTDQNISAEYSSDTGKTLLSTMFEQAKSPVAADLLNISLQVKGDPFWLEPPPVGRTRGFQSTFDRELAKYNRQPTSTGGTIVVEGGEQDDSITAETATQQTFMLFRSFTPQEADIRTGITPKFTANNALNGLYAVRTVQHSFAAGQFTQTLEGIRNPQISLDSVDLGLGVADPRPTIFEQLGTDDLVDPPTIDDEITNFQENGPNTSPGGSTAGLA